MILLPFYVDDIIKTALTEDINYIDSTADLLIPEDSISSAYFMSKADGVLCGLEVALRVFTILDPEMKIECRFKDGDKVKYGDIIAEFTGHPQDPPGTAPSPEVRGNGRRRPQPPLQPYRRGNAQG